MASYSLAGSPRSKGKINSSSPTDGDDGSTPEGCSSDVKDQRDPFVLAPRPAAGRLGAPIKICANLFTVTVAAEMNIYLYEVVVEDDRLPPSVNREVMKALINTYECYFGDVATVYDGRRKLYTNALVPIDRDQESVQVILPQERLDEVFTVKIRLVRKVNIDCRNGLYAMHTVLKHYSSLSFTQVGSSFFEKSRRLSTALGSGREIWFGFHQSIRPTQLGTMLNIDVLATAFYKDLCVIDFLREMFDPHTDFIDQPDVLMSDNQRSKLARELRGLRIYTTHINNIHRKYRVCNVTRKSANAQLFPLADEKGLITEISVAEYFLRKYNHELRYGYLPCLQVGREEGHVYLPLEVCTIAKGQRCSRKLTDAQTSAMIKTTARSAPDRVQATMALAEKLSAALGDEKDGFRVTVHPNMAMVTGRILPAPRILYGGKTRQVVTPDKGIWDMRGKQYFSGVEVHTWAVACFVQCSLCSEAALMSFVGSIQHIANDNGMTMSARPCFCKYAVSCEQVEPMFKFIQSAFPSIQLIVVILGGKTPIYAEVKRVGDTLLGVATQCVQVKHVTKLNSQTLSNLCLKINVKLGGINSVLLPQSRPAVFNEPVVFFGADLCHPSPSDPSKPTIVSVVASMDGHPSSYSSLVRLQYVRLIDGEQQRRSESIEELDTMAVELLLRFYRITRFKPSRIFYFRSGIPESVSHHVLHDELVALRKACLTLQSSYQPGITFIAVQKNHHTRLFCADRRNMSGRSGNVPAGTIVDSGITDQQQFDFYMCSHSGVQGTSRPCRYHVLWDDNKMSSDELETLIYQLCHTYARCTRAVSVPAPIYYAHLAVQRARHHCADREFESEYDTAGTNTASASHQIAIHEKLKCSMYFC
uniref:ALG-6 n=1 Tax=Ascaris suum TaxID=6253 RepID=F1KS28_ASCSU|nr:ALG-6 [Ascaris suum]